MAAGVVSVGGKSYAVALYWQVSDSSNATKAAKAAARQSGTVADFYCVRPGNAKGRAAQFGLGEARLGHKWNMPSAAASLANRQPGSWAGVFVVPGGAWFAEVRDDLIAPEGDLIFADEAEAMVRLQEASAHGGLEKIFAPENWAIPGAESRSLASLLSGKADAPLHYVKMPAKVLKVVAGAAVLLCLLAVFGFYLFLQAQKKAQEAELLAQVESQRLARMEEEQRREEERKKQEAAARTAAEQIVNKPWYNRVWESAPPPLVWLDACRQTMDKVQLSPLGWTLASVSCTDKQVTATWARGTGPAVIPAGAQLDVSMRSASASFDLPPLAPRGPELLWPSQAIVLYALQNDWTAGLGYMAEEPIPPLSNGQVPPPPPWVKRQIQWSVPLSPWTLKGPLVDLPGIVLHTLTRAPDGSWAIEGVLYEQRK